MNNDMKKIEAQTERLCNELMIGVVKTGAVTHENAHIASKIMKDEINAFLFGDEYKDERHCLNVGSVSFQYIWSSVILGAANKIRHATKAGAA